MRIYTNAASPETGWDHHIHPHTAMPKATRKAYRIMSIRSVPLLATVAAAFRLDGFLFCGIFFYIVILIATALPSQICGL